jgi:hypothetical protein
LGKWKERIVEPGYSNVMALIALARKADEPELTAEQRGRIVRNLLQRMEKERERRRVMQAFAAGASAVLLVGLLVRLMTG